MASVTFKKNGGIDFNVGKRHITNVVTFRDALLGLAIITQQADVDECWIDIVIERTGEDGETIREWFKNNPTIQVDGIDFDFTVK